MMRRFILIAVIIILMGNAIHAQIVLSPGATGNIQKSKWLNLTWWAWMSGTFSLTGSGSYFDYDVFTPQIKVRDSLTYQYTSFSSDGFSRTIWQNFRFKYNHGILEFNLSETLSGNTFPPSQMTTSNWTARIIDLDLVFTSGPPVQIFNLADSFEDGILTEAEFDGHDGLLAEGIHFAEIDITEVLRNDLFGPGAGGVTSGFIFITGEGTKVYDHELPRIEIHGTWPTPTPPPSATPTASPTPTVSPTPNPPAEPGVTLYLSQTTFSYGDLFKLDVVFTKYDSEVYHDIPFVLMLDVFGEYFWYPSWENGVQYIFIDLDSGIVRMPILEFSWPDVSGTIQGITFYGALLNADLSDIFGDWDSTSFGWE